MLYLFTWKRLLLTLYHIYCRFLDLVTIVTSASQEEFCWVQSYANWQFLKESNPQISDNNNSSLLQNLRKFQFSSTSPPKTIYQNNVVCCVFNFAHRMLFLLECFLLFDLSSSCLFQPSPSSEEKQPFSDAHTDSAGEVTVIKCLSSSCVSCTS